MKQTLTTPLGEVTPTAFDPRLRHQDWNGTADESIFHDWQLKYQYVYDSIVDGMKLEKLLQISALPGAAPSESHLATCSCIHENADFD